MAEPTVRMSGIVLASLMFHHVNSDSDVEGLVLGESRFDEQITISDSQADHIHIEETYNVQKHIACHRLNMLYDSTGQVNVEAVKKMLADNKQESVIGWYRQRRNSDQNMTFREKKVHESLKNFLSNPHLVFLLLTPCKVTAPGSTHRTEYSAFISRSRRFVNVPVLVGNLGLLEQLAYWKDSAPNSAAGYSRTMKRHGSRFFCSSGLLREVTEVNKMNDSLQSELKKTCRDVEDSERQVEALQEEISTLRRRLREEAGFTKGGKEEDVVVVATEPRNRLLLDAVTVLFVDSPLFTSQTLTLDAFPVPDGVSMTTQVNPETTTASTPASVAISRKRPGETVDGMERKRRRSKT
ncbi:BRCA1-A complex subunit Abraxas 1 [Mugil cephalus]|uniref:BRCA1-A complex subunit Abraxas 1 n=1 Tax=Mugil cephalus TaxID=48193 RepID=UPI001FB72BBB|nr:BRCA1-A complex subunit Abraxas 1 [Mugil cephalus]